MDFSQLLILLIDGLLIGGSYVLLGLGMTLVNNVAGIINLAHGHIIALAAYLSYLLWTYGFNPLLSFLICTPLFFMLGIAIHKISMEKVLEREVAAQSTLTFGLAFVIADILMISFGGVSRGINYLNEVVTLGIVNVLLIRLVIFAVSMSAIIVLWFFMNRTFFGKAVRAIAQDSEMAALCGAPRRRVITIIQGFGFTLAAMAGCAMAMLSPFDPYGSAWVWLFRGFVILTIAGPGSILGVVVGALALGWAESFSSIFLPAGFSRAVGFLVLIILVSLKPEGMFGERRT